ncbi:membrane-bound alpha-1,6- mannosyltransferase Initiation-specific [Chytriomyces hyalinus]|nr:membrane-bound alpha-1,6- mannosyltransferase Initiation-specific [Chytriomyces hyalinus]
MHQTYRTATIDKWAEEYGPNNRTNWFLSWRIKHPGATHSVLDDASADAFMRKYFNGPIYETYTKMPLMVLKADMLRYAMLYVHGGIYADSDTQCIKGINEWTANYTDAEFIVSVEWYKDSHQIDAPQYRKTQIVQWTFASIPAHPIFINTLNEIVKVASQATPEFLQNKDNVEGIGGPRVFTRFVQQFLEGRGETLDAMDKSIGDNRFYFEKSRVLVLPMFSFMAQLGKSETTGFVNHYFGGTYLSNGWKNA